MESFNNSRNTGMRVTQEDKMPRVQVTDIYVVLTFTKCCALYLIASIPSQHREASLVLF